jgi:hypothetical protein
VATQGTRTGGLRLTPPWIITDVRWNGSRVIVTLESGEVRRVGWLGVGELATLIRTSPALFDGKPAKEAR